MTKATIETILSVVNFLIILGTLFLVFSGYSDTTKIVVIPFAFLIVNVLGFAEGRYSKAQESKV